MLKLRLLQQYKKPRTDEMAKALGQELFAKLFRSASGHNLGLLAEHAGLSRLLAVERVERKDALLQGQVWARMREEARPYSLRYGTVKLQRTEALEEIEFASEIAQVIDKIRTKAPR
jgi:hypothetical protein